MISVYDNQDIGQSPVVYIFHKGIISLVLCGYEVQMNMKFLILSESPSLSIYLIGAFVQNRHIIIITSILQRTDYVHMFYICCLVYSSSIRFQNVISHATIVPVLTLRVEWKIVVTMSIYEISSKLCQFSVEALIYMGYKSSLP